MFFSKRKQTEMEEYLHQELQVVYKKFDETHKQLTELQEQVQKSTRVNYKSGKSLQEKLDNIGNAVQKRPTTDAGVKEDPLVVHLIRQINEMDGVLRSEEGDSVWRQMIRSWRDHSLLVLEDKGIRSLVQAGEQFDPQIAEAIEGIKTKDGLEPKDVVHVHRRAFANDSGAIIQKGQVAVVTEE